MENFPLSSDPSFWHTVYWLTPVVLGLTISLFRRLMTHQSYRVLWKMSLHVLHHCWQWRSRAKILGSASPSYPFSSGLQTSVTKHSKEKISCISFIMGVADLSLLSYILSTLKYIVQPINFYFFTSQVWLRSWIPIEYQQTTIINFIEKGCD